MAADQVALPPGFELDQPPPGFVPDEAIPTPEVATPSGPSLSTDESIVRTPVMESLKQLGESNFKQQGKPVTNFAEAVEAGWGMSVSQLIAANKMPDFAVDEDTTWYHRAVANFSTLFGDSSWMATGAAIGSGPGMLVARAPGAVVGAMGGAFALPAGLRYVLVDAIQRGGKPMTRGEVVDLAVRTMWETSKAWVTGAAAGQAGLTIKAMLPAATSVVSKVVAPTAAELATMVTVSKGLEGKLPAGRDWLDGAIILFGAKGAVKGVTKLQNIWAKTGKRPEEIVRDAQREPGIWQDLLSEKDVPDAYLFKVEPRVSVVVRPKATTEPELGARQTIIPTTAEEVAATWDTMPQQARSVFVQTAKQNKALKPIAESVGELTTPYAELKPEQQTALNRLFGVEPTLTPEAEARAIPEPSGKVEPTLTPEAEARAIPEPSGKVEPTLTPEAEARAIRYFERPFPDVIMGHNEPPRPTHINYKYQDTTEAVKQSEQLLSELYELRIQTQRRGKVSWEQTYKEAQDVFAELLGVEPGQVAKALEKELGPVEPSKLAATLYARKEIATGVAEELMRKREALVAKGTQVTAADRLEFIAAMENAGNVLSNYLGIRAETGRALNILKSTRRDAEQLKAIRNLINEYGGEGKVDKIIEMMGELQTPAKALTFAKAATTATKWDMVVEAYRAILISGQTTMQVNAISTALFSAMRLPTRTVAAAYGKMHGGDKVYFGESVGVLYGWWAGVLDAAKAVAATAKGGYITAKDEGLIAAGRKTLSTIEAGAEGMAGERTAARKAIPGATGEIIRLPFLQLALPDLFLKTLNQRAELYALATRNALSENLPFGSEQFGARVAEYIGRVERYETAEAMARAEGLKPGSPEIKARVLQLTEDAVAAEMSAAARAAGFRNTFNAPPGEVSQALGRLIGLTHTEPIVPFRRTLGNLFKEGARMTPGFNLLVRDWREDYNAGGARRDMALAEVTVGASLYTALYFYAKNNGLTGGGSPDPNQRRTDYAAGWRPYAFRVGNKYIEGYQRMAPYGQIVGIAADFAEIEDYMTKEEHDQLARMIAFAFAKNVTNQTFMTGITNAINLMQDPARYGESYTESFAGSLVPGLLAQTAREEDPLLREINGSLEAIRSRIPIWREGLLPKKDIWGQPVPAPEKLWKFSPFAVAQVSGDKVRTEAMRIGFATGVPPKKMEVGTALLKDTIELTPQQRDLFATEAGKLAHELLSIQVNAVGWDRIPDLLKRRIYETTYARAREAAMLQMLSPEKKAQMKEDVLRRLQEELQ